MVLGLENGAQNQAQNQAFAQPFAQPLRLFPNPTNGTVLHIVANENFINENAANDKVMYETATLYNALGQPVFIQNINETISGKSPFTLHLPNLAAGIYTIELKSAHGTQRASVVCVR